MKTQQTNNGMRKIAAFVLLLGLLPHFGFGVVFPPTITSQSASQTVLVQQPATFQVVVSGTAPFSYQWRKNGTNISGATSSSYTIPSAQLGNQAAYSVLVTNLVGSATSSNAILNVINSAVSVEATTVTSSNTSQLTWSHTVGTNANRMLMVATSHRNGNNSVTGVTYGGVALTKIGSTNAPSNVNSCSLWQLLAPPSGTAPVVVNVSGGAQDIVAGATSFAGVNQSTPLGAFAASADKDNQSGPTTVAAAANPGDLVMAVLIANASAVSATNASGQAALWNLKTGTGGSDIIGASGIATGGTNVSLTWKLGAGAPWALGAVAIKPFVNSPPTVNAQSVNATANSTKAITLTGSDADNNPLTFAVVTSPANGGLSGLNPTNGTVNYTPNTNFTGADSFTFRVNDGTTNSDVATVSITVSGLAPTITIPPQSQTLFAGQNTTFNVAATGTGPLCYQWSFCGTNLVGATNAWLSVTNARLAQTGSYTVVITNTAGSAASAATLSVTSPVIALSLAPDAAMAPAGFPIQVAVGTNVTYVVLVSTDLQTWTPLATNMAATASDVFLDATATNYSQRFYRVMAP
ncbi:MAG TPA: immunoglobulin domain-containing protein [Verrucomicrobiae bacterium]|nr:immunoglobulin domain-containing protein [Verrucomicrobiae bacterium]